MPDNLDQLFSARREIDRAIAEHTRDLAVMFTDIVGSTQYFERNGDIEGLSLVKRHNAALFPVVEQHRGRVVKTIGDAILAVFENPVDGIHCALEMQRTLAKHNGQVSDTEQEIHVRIGVHAGKVVLDQGDVFGDTVNTASRVAHEAKGDEVLLSASLAALAPPADGLRVEGRGSLALKGKAEPLPVVRALWRADALPSRREPEPSGPRERAPEVFVLELGAGPTGLKVAVVDGAGDKGTVKSYQEVPLDAAGLNQIAAPFGAFGRGASASYVDQLKAVGQELYRRALSERAQEHLRSTRLAHLRLQLDDHLVHIPWELLHDGKEFVGLRFAVGRLVAARAATSPSLRLGARSLKRALVVGDPGGDLPSARREGHAVAGLLKEGMAGKVELREGPLTRSAFLQAIADCDLLHFAGHSRTGRGGGFQLADGVASPDEVRLALAGSAPLLVFANGCHASTSTGWMDGARGLYTLGSALLLSGVQHYLGPLWEIPDADGLGYALRFYEAALSGVSLGEAARRARQSLLQPPAQATSFAGYVLYGDPRATLPLENIRLAPAVSVRSSGEVRAPAFLSTAGPAVYPVMGEPMPPSGPAAPGGRARLPLPLLGAAAGVAAVVAASGAWWVSRPAKPPLLTTAPAPVVVPVADPARHTGPLRVSVLPFKNVSGEARLDHLKDALAEAVVTDLGGIPDTKLIERGQLDVDLGELDFSQSKYVDPATRAALGKINGAEVVVLGGYQRAGDQIRINARLVDAETGEVLGALKAEKPEAQLFELQDALTAALRESLGSVRSRLRK